MSVSSLAYRVREAASSLRGRLPVAPRVGIILGSGLGPLADEVRDATEVPYAEIPHFAVSTVAGHAGQLVSGTLEGVPVAVLRGRVHFYEAISLIVILPGKGYQELNWTSGSLFDAICANKYLRW